MTDSTEMDFRKCRIHPLRFLEFQPSRDTKTKKMSSLKSLSSESPNFMEEQDKKKGSPPSFDGNALWEKIQTHALMVVYRIDAVLKYESSRNVNLNKI